MTASKTAFGNLSEIVSGIKSIIGENGLLVANVEYKEGTITVTYSDGTTSSFTLDGVSVGGVTITDFEFLLYTKELKITFSDSSSKTVSLSPIISKSLTFDDLSSKVRLTFQDDTYIETGALPIGGASAMPTKVGIDTTNTETNFDPCLKDAFHDFLSILPNITSDKNLTLVPNNNSPNSNYSRVDGKILRFFNNSPTTNEYKYTILDGTTELFNILPQEAYSMIFHAASTKWVVIPGIINVKNRRGSFAFEELPSAS